MIDAGRELRWAYDQIVGLCEALEDEAEADISRTTFAGEHAQGYLRGQRITAKSIRRAAGGALFERIRSIELETAS